MLYHLLYPLKESWSILNILRLSVAVIPDNDTRAEKIASSKTYFDLASSKLQPSLADNTSNPPPLNTDEILLNTFAISFAMQLDQIILFDNKTTSTYSVPRSPNNNLTLTCSEVDISDSDAQANLRAMDGHLWEKERNGMQCARVLNAYNDADNKTAAANALAVWVAATADGDNVTLPDPFYDAVCPSFKSLTDYLTDLAANIAELNKKLTLSGDNTKAITEAQTSSDKLLKSIGCFE